MKKLKNYDVEPGDIIVGVDDCKYRFIKFNTNNYNGFTFPYIVSNVFHNHEDALNFDFMVKQIIKKDLKKEILQKIEEHKSEIQILENQLKEMNSLKVGEVYRVTEEFFKDGVIFSRGELLYLVYNNCQNHVFRSNRLSNKTFKIDSIHPKLELINDPEMKNGLVKFFKGNS